MTCWMSTHAVVGSKAKPLKQGPTPLSHPPPLKPPAGGSAAASERTSYDGDRGPVGAAATGGSAASFAVRPAAPSRRRPFLVRHRVRRAQAPGSHTARFIPLLPPVSRALAVGRDPTSIEAVCLAARCAAERPARSLLPQGAGSIALALHRLWARWRVVLQWEFIGQMESAVVAMPVLRPQPPWLRLSSLETYDR